MIKRLILAVALICVSVPTVVLAWDTWRSSYTATIDTTKNLCGTDAGLVGPTRRGFLHSVCISSSAFQTDTITIYNSSGTAINPLTTIDGTAYEGCFNYDVVASTINKGLTYSKTGGAIVQIQYDCY